MPAIKTHSCYHGDVVSDVYCAEVSVDTKGQKGSFNSRLSPHMNEKSLGRAWE